MMDIFNKKLIAQLRAELFLVQQDKTAAEYKYETGRASLQRAHAQYNRMHDQMVDAQTEAASQRLRADNAERNCRLARSRVRELEAILAARQTNQRGAGEVAFDRIVRDVTVTGRAVYRRPEFATPYSAPAKNFALQADFSHLEARTLAYLGHVGEGGLQRHSIGKIYPLIVYGKDQWSFGDTRYHIMDARTGHTFLRSFESSALAEGHAELIHSLNKQYGTDLRIAADGRFVNHHKGA